MVRTIAGWLTANGPDGFSDTVRAILFRNGPIYLDQPAEIYQPQ